jgi:hypothetical protein
VSPAYALDVTVVDGRAQVKNTTLEDLKSKVGLLLEITDTHVDAINANDASLTIAKNSMLTVDGALTTVKSGITNAKDDSTSIGKCGLASKVFAKNTGLCNKTEPDINAIKTSLSCVKGEALVVDNVTGKFECKQRLEDCQVCSSFSHKKRSYTAAPSSLTLFAWQDGIFCKSTVVTTTTTGVSCTPASTGDNSLITAMYEDTPAIIYSNKKSLASLGIVKYSDSFINNCESLGYKVDRINSAVYMKRVVDTYIPSKKRLVCN